jgi:hypothetical protein
MKGGQVVVVGWGLERKGGRESEGERLDTKLPKSKKKQTPILSFQTPPQSSSPQTNPLISITHTVRTIQSAFAKAKATNPQIVYAKPSHPSSTISPLLSHPPSSHPQTIPLKTSFNESKVRKTAQNHPIHNYPLTIFFTQMLFTIRSS